MKIYLSKPNDKLCVHVKNNSLHIISFLEVHTNVCTSFLIVSIYKKYSTQSQVRKYDKFIDMQRIKIDNKVDLYVKFFDEYVDCNFINYKLFYKVYSTLFF